MSVVIKLQCLHQAYRHQGCMYSGEIGGGGGGGVQPPKYYKWDKPPSQYIQVMFPSNPVKPLLN